MLTGSFLNNGEDGHPQEQAKEQSSHNQKKRQPPNNQRAQDLKSQVQKAGVITQPKTTSVINVEQTRGGALASAMRKKMENLAPMLGFRFRVMESAGTTLADLLSNKNLWQGEACGRKHCHPCQQKSEKREDCSKENVLYESRCTQCNGMEKGKEETTIKDNRSSPSIYVGETSRSLMERAREHQGKQPHDKTLGQQLPRHCEAKIPSIHNWII